jgi:hypothetical protein
MEDSHMKTIKLESQTKGGFRHQGSLAVFTACAIYLAQVGAVEATPGPGGPIIVDSTPALLAALVEENAGRHIVLLAGTYPVSVPLIVPDGVTLEGEGNMLGDELPSGFDPGTETRIIADGALFGDLMTLGDGARLKGLVIENVPGSFGNTVAVGSRYPGDTVSASIVECEIISPNESDVGPNGPVGHTIMVISNNLNGGAPPLPFEGTDITLRLERSIVRSYLNFPGVMAINFASNALINLFLTENVLGGGINVTAGVSRPNEVSNSELMVFSRRNLYIAEEPVYPGVGIQMIGGSGVVIPILAPATTSNHAYLSSRDDQIEGFEVGVAATGGRRMTDSQGPSSDNHVVLRFRGLSIHTPKAPGTADFRLLGADSSAVFPELSPGDDNTVRVLMRGTSGSGPRENVYANTFGPLVPANMGSGNRLEIIGTKRAFQRTNKRIEPAPSLEFFLGGKGKK